MNLQPILKDDLVSLRPLKEQDLEALHQAANDPLIWEQHHTDRYKREEFESFFAESLASKGCLVIIDNQSGQIIGSSRYKLYEDIPNAVEIGWSFLTRKYWGGRYNKAFKALMVNHMLQEVEEVLFYVAEDNMRSRGAMEKLGAWASQEERHRYPSNTRSNYVVYVIDKAL